jgi:hypothetical protein
MAKGIVVEQGEEIWKPQEDDKVVEFYSSKEEGRKYRRILSEDLMAQYMEAIGDDGFMELEYCFFELVNNGISKGNCFDPEKKITVAYHLDSTLFRMRVEDDGAGFNIEKWNIFYAMRKDKERNMALSMVQDKDAKVHQEFLNQSSFNALDKDSQIDMLDTMVTGGTGLVSVVDYFDRVFYNKPDVDRTYKTKVVAIKFFN